jgi:glutamate decarboxylase
MASAFADLIRRAPDFELVTEPELNLLTYRYVPPAVRPILATGSPAQKRAANDRVSMLTESIQKEQRANGKTFVSRTRLEAAAHGGQLLTVFRVVLANPLTTPQILQEILEEQREYGERLAVEAPRERAARS